MLSADTVPLYLLQRGLLDTRSIVEGDVVVIDSSRRNANFKVISTRGPSYLVKQGFGPQRVATLANEASIYRVLRRGGSGGRRLQRYLPVFRVHDRDEHILVIKLVPDAEHLGERQRRTGRFSIGIASEVGRALSILHTEVTDSASGVTVSGTPLPKCEAPWILSAHHATIDLYRQMSNANIQLISLLQHTPAAHSRLDELRQSWQHTNLIHYDLKFENIVIGNTGGGRQGTQGVVKLVDWELAGLGDPLWDMGSVLGDYLGSWLLSIPVTGSHPPDRFLELARYPLAKMQPAMRRLWHTYVQGTHPRGATPTHWPARAAAFAGARLIQTAFEHSQTLGGLTGEALCLMQVGINMLERPQEAAIHLLGIPPIVSWTVPGPQAPAGSAK